MKRQFRPYVDRGRPGEMRYQGDVLLTVPDPPAVPLKVLKVMPQGESKRSARDAALIYAENRLSPWAKWAKEHCHSLKHHAVSQLYRAMQMTKVGIIRGSADPKADKHGDIVYPINANGHETRSSRPITVGEAPEAICEVDTVVATLPKDLHTVIMVDYFTCGPIEERCKETRWKRARYSQLLESAKYSVFVALASRTKLEL